MFSVQLLLIMTLLSTYVRVSEIENLLRSRNVTSERNLVTFLVVALSMLALTFGAHNHLIFKSDNDFRRIVSFY